MLKILYVFNLVRAVPCYFLVKYIGVKKIIEADIAHWKWYINATDKDGFFLCFNRLMCRNHCFRNLVVYRVSNVKKLYGYIIRIFFKIKKDLEIHGEIGEGVVIYHGHGTILNAHKIGKNFSVYQGVTIGKNAKLGIDIIKPTIGDNVIIYTNAVVAGGIIIGNNVSIGAGAVVMKDIPENSVVIGNPCVIKPKK